MKRIVFLLSLFFFIFSSSVSAQTSKTEAIWTKERLDQEIEIVNQDYRDSLEDYRNKENQYQISYDQNQGLNTLATIEDLTQKSKNLAIVRNEVLVNYLNLLKLNLISTEGIELSLKDLYLERVDLLIENLEEFQASLEPLSSREEISLALTDFSQTYKNLDDFTNSILIILATGKLQMVFDKATVLKTDIDSYLDQQTALASSKIERASSETDKQLEDSKANLDVFWEEIGSRSDRSSSLSSLYTNLSQELDPIYVSLSKSLSYLGELIKF